MQPQANMKMDFASVQLVKSTHGKDNDGVTEDGGKIFHVECLEALLGGAGYGFNRARGVNPPIHLPILSEYAKIIFCEHRLATTNTRGKVDVWCPSKAYQFVLETWKAVQEFENRTKTGLAYPTAALSPAVEMFGHEYIGAEGEPGTIYHTKQALDFCQAIGALDIPQEARPDNMRGKLLSELFRNENGWITRLQECIDEEEMNRTKYIAWYKEQELLAEPSNGYHKKKKAAMDLVGIASEAWATILHSDLTEMTMDMEYVDAFEEGVRRCGGHFAIEKGESEEHCMAATMLAYAAQGTQDGTIEDGSMVKIPHSDLEHHSPLLRELQPCEPEDDWTVDDEALEDESLEEPSVLVHGDGIG